jgi:acyl carrier protein
MEHTEILNRLRQLITENLELELPETLHETDRLFEDLNIDSIMVLQLIVYVEEEFGVNVPEEDVDPAVFQTLGSFVGFVQTLMSQKQV